MRRLVSLLGLSAALACGQYSNTINQRLFTNTTTSPYTTAPLRNIGQGYHVVGVTFANNGAATCADPVDIPAIQASFDNSTWFRPPQLVQRDTTIAAGYYETVLMIGAYPYVRFYLAFDKVNCTATANYSGTLYPVNPQLLVGTNTQQLSAGAGTSSSFDISAATTTTLAAKNGQAPQFLKISILGFYLYNTAAQTITLQDSVGTKYAVWSNFPAGGQVYWPNTGIGQVKVPKNRDLQLVTSAATEVSGWIIYKYE